MYAKLIKLIIAFLLFAYSRTIPDKKLRGYPNMEMVRRERKHIKIASYIFITASIIMFFL